MKNEEPGEWVPKAVFVMPLLPPKLKVDPVLAALLHCVAFLELSEEEAVDPDGSVEAMEHVAAYLGRLTEEQKEAIGKQLSRISAYARKQGAPESFIELVDEFLENFGADEGDDE